MKSGPWHAQLACKSASLLLRCSYQPVIQKGLRRLRPLCRHTLGAGEVDDRLDLENDYYGYAFGYYYHYLLSIDIPQAYFTTHSAVQAAAVPAHTLGAGEWMSGLFWRMALFLCPPFLK